MALPGNPVADRAAQIGANSSAVADFVDGIATDTVTDPLTYVGGIGLGVSGASLFGRLTSFFRKTDVPKEVKELSTQQQKAIRSLEKQIAIHGKKVQEFKDNPTIRPGNGKLANRGYSKATTTANSTPVNGNKYLQK